MLRSYYIAAVRNLFRNGAYAAINIFGLSIGFAAAILIALYVRDEYSYDRFLPDHERLFKVDEVLRFPGRPPIAGSQTFSDIATGLKLEFPDVEMTARLARTPVTLRRGDITGTVREACWVDADFFTLFPFTAVQGNLRDALRRPDGIILTRSIARRFFGRDPVVGESITLDGEHEMRVSAVIEDLPSNTHLAGEVFLPGVAAYSDLTQADAVSWGAGTIKSASIYTYVRLRAGADVRRINAQMPAFVARHLPSEYGGVPMERILSMSLVPVADSHLEQRQADAMKPQGDPRTLHALIGIAVLILIVAGSNFVSMMTARALRRSVEVGVRKAAGATRRQIIEQFMTETLAYVLLALLAAMALVEVLLPSFDAFLRRGMVFDYVRQPTLGACLLAVAAAVGLAAGAYPSWVLSRFRPAVVLRGAAVLAGGAGGLRRLLVVIQFATLVALIVVTWTVHDQAQFALRDRLRLPNDILYLSFSGCSPAVADAVAKLSGVRAANCASSVAVAQSHWSAGFTSTEGSAVSIESAMIDYGYFDLFGIRPVAGRLPSRDHGEDGVLQHGDDAAVNPAMILNESAARALGYASPLAAIGQFRRWTRPEIAAGSARLSEPRTSQIVGVVPDFSIGSVRDVIEPTVYYVDPTLSSNALLLRLSGDAIPETLAAVRRSWTEQGESRPFEGVFLSQYLDDLYTDIRRESRIFTGFAGVAVAIAALGLLGLAIFTAERKTQEIGLRKALGASRADILRFLGWQFARPVLLAALLGWPCAYLFLRLWLEGFAYHIDQTAGRFLGGEAAALAIAVVTVMGHALRVARARPVDALRYE